MEPREMTVEGARKEGEELRERREAADREDAPLLIQQLTTRTPEEEAEWREVLRQADREDAPFPMRKGNAHSAND